ncbi:MAG TPA: rhodanese-like domain-containing protein [Chitinispirillaceae bacterium]|nr:rhodanese-like domain-containing protein [Chitinispirillaceae bacterium]
MNLKCAFLTCALLSTVAIMCINDVDPNNEPNQQITTGLVTTEWLSSKLTQKDVVIVDVRSSDEFANGRIPNSINIPFVVPVSVWTAMKGDLLVEVPAVAELAAKLGENGINDVSQIVLVTDLPDTTNPYSLAAPTRVALTLAYAGISNALILDGGFDKWVSEGRTVSKETKAITPVTCTAKENTALFAGVDYVKANPGNAPIVDARDADVYAGKVIEPWANKAGHIPGALSLPAPLFWNTDGTYKTKTEIESIVKPVVGTDYNKEVIVYCGVGGYASTVWFVLTHILDYKQVKVFDGSSQEWVLLNDMVVTTDQ